MGNKKAPGEDGMTGEIYTEVWKLLDSEKKIYW
jgi:hypothetical protein